MEITPLCSMMGARIKGVDLAAARDNATTDAIQQALVDYASLSFLISTSHRKNTSPLVLNSGRSMCTPIWNPWRVTRKS
jgi:alpha-ketoglutarate-dependent taurine dioxygenase